MNATPFKRPFTNVLPDIVKHLGIGIVASFMWLLVAEQVLLQIEFCKFELKVGRAIGLCQSDVRRGTSSIPGPTTCSGMLARWLFYQVFGKLPLNHRMHTFDLVQ